MDHKSEYDAIIIGSGTSGATIARELSRQNKKVLVVERGGDVPLKENTSTLFSIADQVRLGDGNLSAARALTAGGSTSLYFGVVSYPDAAKFSALGIDLSSELEAVRKELPIATLPDEILGEKSRRLRDAAVSRGHAWHKHDMLIDLSKCTAGYSYGAKWKAKTYLEDAVRAGATLISRATVDRVIVDGGRAIGVSYRTKKRLRGAELHRVYASKIVLAAGELASPKILRESGIRDVAARGFFCSPGHALFGLVPDMKGGNSFVGSMGNDEEDGIELGDANMAQPMYGLMMLGGLNFRHLVAFPRCLGIGVKVHDDVGGRLNEDGSFHKEFPKDVHDRLRKGKQEAISILRQAGARDVVDFGLNVGGRVGGMVRINEHVDTNFETRYRNLHVCDGSVIPDDMKGPPAVSIMCLAKYLSKHLLARL